MNHAGIFVDDHDMTAVQVFVMVFDGIAARIARMRAKNRDQARENRAYQRQEYDCLVHPLLNPSSD